MRNLSVGLLGILLTGSFLATGCTTKQADASTVLAPHRTDIYFLMDRPNGFVAYVPEGSVRVGIKIQANVTEPYIEVPKQVNNDSWAGPKGEYVAWGLGGTLYVRDLEQLKSLVFIK